MTNPYPSTANRHDQETVVPNSLGVVDTLTENDAAAIRTDAERIKQRSRNAELFSDPNIYSTLFI